MVLAGGALAAVSAVAVESLAVPLPPEPHALRKIIPTYNRELLNLKSFIGSEFMSLKKGEEVLNITILAILPNFC